MTVLTDTQNPVPLSSPRRRALYWRLIALLLIVIVVLGIANLAILGLRTLDRPGQPAPKALLYASTFDAYNEEWDQFIGQMSAQIANHSLVIKVDTAHDGIYSALNHDFGDFDVRVNARRLVSEDPNASIGLLFRYQDRNDFYMFVITNDSYCVERHQGGKVDKLSACHHSSAVLPGLNTVNQMRVVGQGGHFKFYVNDQQLLLCPKGSDKFSTWIGSDQDQCASNNKQTSNELVDNTFDYGKIGVGVRTEATPGIQVAFNNVLVYGP